MSLVNELIKDLLPEEEKKQTTAVYAGGFKPPHEGHFTVVEQALKENPEIDEFIIFVGEKERNGITQAESVLVWEIYNNYLPFKVKIEPTSIPPIKSVYDFAKNHPTREVLWVIGAREGNEEDFKDITKRTKSISQYPNLELRTIVTSGGVSGTAARNASQVSLDKFDKFMPGMLNPEEKQEVFDLVSGKIKEGRKKKKDPKTGTGKKPKGSGRRLYTDEDPSDTVSIKFSTRQDIVNTLNKKSFKAKSHARQSQIINLIHQRVRAALGRTKDPKKKAKLQTGFKYITKRKEASKAKTQRLKKQKLKEKKGYGKSSGYRYRSIYKKDGKFYFMQDNPFSPGIRQEFGPYKTKQSAIRKMESFPPGTSYRDLTEEELYEKLCKRGKAYIAKRKREGEKHNPFLAGRAVKVCKGQMSGVDGKQKKDFRPKRGKKRSAQGRKPDIIKEIGIELSNYSGQILPGDVLRAPKGFPLGGKKLEKSIQLKVVKNSREGVNRYKLSLEDSNGKKYSVRNFEMDGEYKGKKLPKWGLVRKSKKNVDEGDTIEKYSAKGKATGKLKQGTVRKRLGIKKGEKIPMYKIDKEISRLKKMDKDPDKKGAQLGDKNQKYYKALQLAKTLKSTTHVNEAIDSSKFDFEPYIVSLTQHMSKNGLKLEPYPQIHMIHDDIENGEDVFGKTAYYAPQTNVIVLFTHGRHPKDILRSYAHELIHVHQNMENRLQTIDTTDVNEDDYLEQLEREAYETGNIMFRSWTDSITGSKLEESVKTLITEKKKKDPFGLLAYAQELGRLREEESEYKVYLDMDGVLADFDKRFTDLSGMSPEAYEAKYGRNKFWDFIDEEHKIKFWVGIEPMPGASDLVNAVKKYNYELLTSPSAKKQSYLGKILWVRNNSSLLGGKPRINFKKASEKHEVKPQLSKTDILIDDRADTIERWNAAGGTGIVYRNISQVLNDLAELGL